MADSSKISPDENPYGPSPAARAAILEQLHVLHRYPDPLGAGLKRAPGLRQTGGYGLPEWLRITVGSVDENRRLLVVLDEVLA